MWRQWRVYLLALSLGLGITAKSLAGGPTFTTIDFPGAVFTLAGDINRIGQIVGRYIDTAGINHGFLLSHGRFSSIDFPGATGFTRALGINSGGDIVGDYFIGNFTGAGDVNITHGYLLSGGAFTKIDFPGADDTEPVGINTGGDIVGHYTESNGSGDTKTHGFLLRAGTFSSIDIPGATYTEAWRINDNGQIAGRFKGGDGKFHVYVLTNGSFTTIDFPGAVITLGFGLNSSDDVVGGYRDTSGGVHGYLRTP